MKQTMIGTWILREFKAPVFLCIMCLDSLVMLKDKKEEYISSGLGTSEGNL